ncbi:MAG: DUF1292 domain-containing protein [Clostridia bacterium]|nr:DUF1292 domain-containing protein [Clostridia bacterium]
MQEEYTPDLISLTDDEGNEYNFEVLDAIETDEARYVALTPIYDDPKAQVDDDGSLIIMRAVEEDGENYFEEIEDDDEYETIADAFISRLQDFYEIDEQ